MYKPCPFSVEPWAEKENLLQRKDIFKGTKSSVHSEFASSLY